MLGTAPLLGALMLPKWQASHQAVLLSPIVTSCVAIWLQTAVAATSATEELTLSQDDRCGSTAPFLLACHRTTNLWADEFQKSSSPGDRQTQIDFREAIC